MTTRPPLAASSDTKRPSLFASLAFVPDTIRLVQRSSPLFLPVLAIITVGLALAPLAMAYVAKRIIDSVAEHAGRDVYFWVGVELGLAVLTLLLSRGNAIVRTLAGARIGIDTNLRILERAKKLPLAKFEDPEFYDRMTRARREASSRPVGVVTTVFELLQNGITLVGAVVLLGAFNLWAALVVFVAAVPSTFAELRYSQEAFRLRNRRAPESRTLQYYEHVLANETYAKEVRAFGLGDFFLRKYESLAEKLYAEDRALSIRRTASSGALSLLSTASFYGYYAVVAASAVKGSITIGDLALYIAAFQRGQSAFQSVLSAIAKVVEDNLYMSNLFGFLKEEVPEAAAGPRALAPAGPGISLVLEDVGFRYPDRENFAVRHVDLALAEGDSLAIVGQNGSGKSTLIKLITGLYQPTEGRVLLGGRDLREMDAEERGRLISVIFQDFGRYQLTMAENVGLGDVPKIDETDRIEGAITRAGARALRERVGLDNPLGRWFRREGVELSGGEWQRIALARAFMRDDAKLILLDEPSSALDAEAEAALFDRFQSLAGGKTTILVSHRFATVRSAKQIVVVDAGAIVERGTHQSLVEQDGIYARLFQLQAAGYQA